MKTSTRYKLSGTLAWFTVVVWAICGYNMVASGIGRAVVCGFGVMGLCVPLALMAGNQWRNAKILKSEGE